MPLASSTVMTPSLPTFSMASDRILDGLVAVGRHDAHLGDLLGGSRLIRLLAEILDQRSYRAIDAALEIHGVRPGGGLSSPRRMRSGQKPPSLALRADCA